MTPPQTEQNVTTESLELAQFLAKSLIELGACEGRVVAFKVLGTSVRQWALLTTKTVEQSSWQTHDFE